MMIRSLTRCVAATIATTAAFALGGTVVAEEVGRFSIVTNQVSTLKPGSSAPLAAAVGSRIVIDERETTGEASAAQMMFGEGATVSIGAKTSFAVTKQVVDEATGASASAVDLLLGKIRVFVSRFWSDRPEVRVSTPTAVVGIKGSEAVIEVFEDGTTRVSFLSGSGRARAKRAGSPWRDMKGGEQVTIRSDTGEIPPPDAIGADLEQDLIAATRPVPDAAREMPKGRAGGNYGLASAKGAVTGGASAQAAIVATLAPASGGNGFMPPEAGKPPDPQLPCVRNPQTGKCG